MIESQLNVRQMQAEETQIIIDYFYSSTPEHLERLGVDPTRFWPREKWMQFYQTDHGRALKDRASLQLIWLSGDQPIGFSTADKINFGVDARMHLHVIDPDNRRRGFGTECVRQSVDLYFELLNLKRLFCEPNAFNVPPNRTIQKAGFTYVKTHKTVPNRLNYHQAVTRWVFERGSL